MELGKKQGKVYLVGAGPGDADLITRRGYELLYRCDVVVYDNLVSRELIVGLPRKTDRIYVGKKAGRHTMSQEQINELLVKLAQEGKRVVRLKGGDPFIFGRGGEEALCLAEYGIAYEVVPGVTAGVAALAYAGIPATHRGMANYVIFVPGHEAAEGGTGKVAWEWLAKTKNATLVGYMGVRQLPQTVVKLIEGGMSPQTPAAMIERGTFGTQRTICAPLESLPAAAQEAEIHPPALFVIGEVASLNEKLRWFENLPLFGKRVLVTRPADQSVEFYRSLRQLGADVVPLPTLFIAPEYDRRGWARMQARCQPGDWLYFASENGVQYFLHQRCYCGQDIRSLSVFSIAVPGNAAQNALRTAGLQADLIAETPTPIALAKEMAEKLNLAGRRIIRVRGTLGDDKVDAILSSTGAEIIPLVVYRTFTAKWESEDLDRLGRFPPDIILFSGGSEVSALVRILGKDRARDLAASAITASIGPSTSAIASKYGLAVTVESSLPSLDGLVHTILQYLAGKKGG